MLYLVTGRNGAGKTQIVLRALLDDPRFKGRPLVTRGIPLDRQKAGAAFRMLAQDPSWISSWWELTKDKATADNPRPDASERDLPPGVVFILDEAWDLLSGARGAQAELHPWISPLRTHRHFGFDFIIIGQHAMDFPPVVRALAAEHWHVMRTAGRVRVLIWRGQVGDHQSTTDLQRSEEFPLKVPSDDAEVWSLYHSADLHTKQPGHGRKFQAARRKLIWMAAGILLSLGAALYFFFSSVGSDSAPVALRGLLGDEVAAIADGVLPVAGEVSTGAVVRDGSADFLEPQDQSAEIRAGWLPGLDGLAWDMARDDGHCLVLVKVGTDTLPVPPPWSEPPSRVEFPPDRGAILVEDLEARCPSRLWARDPESSQIAWCSEAGRADAPVFMFGFDAWHWAQLPCYDAADLVSPLLRARERAESARVEARRRARVRWDSAERRRALERDRKILEVSPEPSASSEP